jgi:phosphoglycerate-specific signal transduction histidine kinase
MGFEQAVRRTSAGVVNLAQFGRKGAGVTRNVANDSSRQLRLGALEGLAPTLIHALAQPLPATSNYLESCAGKIRKRIEGLRIVTSKADGDSTHIRIEDSGRGLSTEVFTSLYRPFVTTKPQGTGLGLPISDTIVQAHGGRLWAEAPEAGRGAVFNVLVPAKVRGLEAL